MRLQRLSLLLQGQHRRAGRTRATCRGCEARYGLDLKKVPFDFPELIAALAPRAFFTSSPLHDANFEVEGVRACITAARPVYAARAVADRLVAIYPDAEHSFPKAARLDAYRFLDRFLAAPP